MTDLSREQQYRAVHESCGIFDLATRGKLRVEGPDHVEFLHSMITNEVRGLAQWTGRYGAFLTHTGKLVSDFYYYRLPDSVLLDLTPGRTGVLREALERFIIMDDVTIVDRSEELAHVALHGPRAPEILEARFPGLLPEEPLGIQQADGDVLLIRKAEFVEHGYELILPLPDAAGFIEGVLDSYRDRGVLQVEDPAHQVLRLEKGIPWFGLDMDENNYPMEAGIDTAISLTKGCFVGQEVVSKATHIGGVRRRLKKLLFEPGDPVPSRGARVLKEGRELGVLTSAVLSIRLGRPIALAYLIQAHASPGDRVTIEAGKASSSAVVVEQFLDAEA